jgi:hypothetical protein
VASCGRQSTQETDLAGSHDSQREDWLRSVTEHRFSCKKQREGAESPSGPDQINDGGKYPLARMFPLCPLALLCFTPCDICTPYRSASGFSTHRVKLVSAGTRSFTTTSVSRHTSGPSPTCPPTYRNETQLGCACSPYLRPPLHHRTWKILHMLGPVASLHLSVPVLDFLAILCLLHGPGF